MKTTSAIVAIALVATATPQYAAAFSGSSFSGTQMQTNARNSGASSLTMEYIPSGMSKEQWKKMKEAEKNKTKGKNLGATGITSFKSRSFAEWQRAGGINLFPVDPKSVKDPKDIPYMQRKGGMPDDSDLKKAPKKGGMFGGLGGGKKKKPAPVAVAVAEPEKKKNWWTL
eukprot:CAMPEP_0198292744 /NCGR_PEP_ID=MMETSP1449-20131203/13839_1 /TAXON_ID=420275 /ORGANISM="Attheya septentrionalis, Strain CCMP2084" /LENGTH=169 /DNA_ID=CAMNT_0043992031 /DNA_START=58 /DNA_END=563 /DNA_ORIENTATION=-